MERIRRSESTRPINVTLAPTDHRDIGRPIYRAGGLNGNARNKRLLRTALMNMPILGNQPFHSLGNQGDTKADLTLSFATMNFDALRKVQFRASDQGVERFPSVRLACHRHYFKSAPLMTKTDPTLRMS